MTGLSLRTYHEIALSHFGWASDYHLLALLMGGHHSPSWEAIQPIHHGWWRHKFLKHNMNTYTWLPRSWESSWRRYFRLRVRDAMVLPADDEAIPTPEWWNAIRFAQYVVYASVRPSPLAKSASLLYCNRPSTTTSTILVLLSSVDIVYLFTCSS
jgi:hypothetical protein